MNKIVDKAAHYLEKKQPFALFVKPNETSVKGYFQKDNLLHTVDNFDVEGFVFTSFNQEEKYLFSAKNCEIIQENYLDNYDYEFDNQIFEYNTIDKIYFEKLVKKALENIQNNNFTKVVLSRNEIVKIESFDVLVAFQKILHLYKNTFRYVWYHPLVGLWMGATPELLCKIEDNHLQTVSLAGTQPKTENPVWKAKEIEEQQIVTQYITEKLATFSEKVTYTEPQTIQAGAILHLKTYISAVLNPTSTLSNIVDVLHPTPAVCGFPTYLAQKFIQENEGYNRTFYTGFLGEIFAKNTAEFYVNLRCLEVLTDAVKLYVGCGITADSNPELEFLETHNKSLTLKKIL